MSQAITWSSAYVQDINRAKVSKAHIPPAVAIRGHTTLRQKTDYRKRYTSGHQLINHVVPEKFLTEISIFSIHE